MTVTDGNIEDIFAEELNHDTVVDEALEDIDIDNPDDGADDFENPTDEPDDEDDVDDVEDTDDDPPSDVNEDGVEWWNEILDRYGDRTVQLTVNGEIVEKPLKDLPSMAMMREDYSRKTAEVSQKAKAAQWAQDVQEAFANDPVGTLEAFARAYQINIGGPQDEPAVDPYEDFDPEVAQVLRQRDELLAQQQRQLEQLTSHFSSVENERLMAEVKAEVAELKSEFGDELDHLEMLRVAAAYNMPLREAAEHLVGKQYCSKTRQQLELDSEAGKIGARKADEERRTAKKRASGTATKKFDASKVAVEDFSDIGELFEINLNSMT